MKIEVKAEWLPEGGVKELVKTPQGREYLGKLQKKYEKFLYQPGSKEFANVYQPKIDEANRVRAKQIRESKEMWQAARAKREWEAKHK